MKIQLDGISNARDIGGIPVDGGIVAPGRLLRSGEHSRMTESDGKRLAACGLRRVIDLRTAAERDNVPDRKINGVEYVNIPIIQATTFGISYESADGPTIALKLQQGIRRMRDKGETPEEHMQELYGRFVRNDHCREHIGQFVRLLADNPTDGATLWHCSAGKDRVGVCTAVLLHCLGASREQIKVDYMLTNELTRDNMTSVVNKVRPCVSPEMMQLVLKMLYVDESYIDTFFAECDRLYDGIDGYVAAIGVTDEHKRKLAENYILH